LLETDTSPVPAIAATRDGVQGNAADGIADHFVLADTKPGADLNAERLSRRQAPSVRRVPGRRKWRERRRRSS
jgi:hypothetical protein